MCFRDRGLFLCSNSVTLEHPFYNTPQGQSLSGQLDLSKNSDDRQQGGDQERASTCRLWNREDGKVMVSVSIPIPSKFENFLAHEEERCIKFSEPSS